MVACAALFMMMIMEILSPHGSGVFSEIVIPIYASSALICMTIHFKK